jgi:arylsulfatase
VPEASAAPTLGRSFKILAHVTLKPGLKELLYHRVLVLADIPCSQKMGKLTGYIISLVFRPSKSCLLVLPGTGEHVIGVEFIKEKMSEKNETLGAMKLYVDGKMMAEASFRTQAVSLCISR